MAQILLVWEDTGGETQAYRLTAGSELAELALQSAGKYINASDLEEGDPIYRLSDKLADLPSVEIDNPIEGPFQTVVICGFIA